MRILGILKRMSRYLSARPRLVQLFQFQDSMRYLDAWVDSNHANCIRTRKSATGVATMVGKNCIRAYTKGQGVIALSSGEAEYYGLTSGMSSVLGDVSMAKDWGIGLIPRCLLDATAGIAIGSRRGLGKVKHIDTVFLWCQEKVNSGHVSLLKRGTKEMIADMLTKQLTESEVVKFLSAMGYSFKSGRHRLALGV